MPSINQVTIMGHLGRDPEVRQTREGQPVVNCTVATEYKPRDREPITEWHRVVAFGVMASQLVEARKGELVTIIGRLQTRSWDDKQSGQKRYQTEVVADVAVRGVWARGQQVQAHADEDEDVPF